MSRFRNIFALIVMATLTFLSSLYFLTRSEYAFGLDGYYYAAQVKSFVEKGRFFMPDFSLSLYALILFSKFGSDIVFTNKVTCSLILSLMVFPSFLIGKKIQDSATGFFLAAFSVSNTFIFFLVVEFIKNLFGVFFFLFFLNEFFFILKNGSNTLRVLSLVVYATLSLLSHKLTGGISFLFIGFLIIREIEKTSVKIGVFFFAVISFFGVSIVLGVWNLFDLERLSAFGFRNFSIPAIEYWKEIQPVPDFYLIEVILFAISPVVGILFWSRFTEIEKKYYLTALFLYGIFSVPFFRFEGKDTAFRLFILHFIPSGVFFALAIGKLFVSSLVRRSFFYVGISILIIFIFLYSIPAKKFHFKRSNVDYSEYSKLLPKIILPEKSLLISHAGFDYFYCYTVRKDAFRFLPEPKHEGRPIYRLVFGLDKNYLLQKRLISSDVVFLNENYTLMKENTWTKVRETMPKNMLISSNNWRNPYRVRPEFLKKRYE